MNEIDWEKATAIICSTLEKLGEPLTDTQRLVVSGQMAVIIERASQEARISWLIPKGA